MSERFNSTTNLTASQLEKHPDEATAQEDVPVDDAAKLRMLGYDAVLGRPLGFWSSSAMNFCHMSFMFEYVILTGMYSYNGPLLFLIGYPCLFILHMILLGPFAELASAYPVAGAMATWSWRCARAGVRHERQWGYLMSGIVLAAHLGKVVALSYKFVMGLTQVYIVLTGARFNPETMVAYDPEAWWHPVFHIVLVSFVALVMLTRVARSAAFWVGCGIFSLFIFACGVASLSMCAIKARERHIPMPVNLGFNSRPKWTRSFGYMIFAGLPLKVSAVDCPAHMSEETENPAKVVPRVMFASTILHFVCTYIMVTLFIFYVAPIAHGQYGINPMLPMQIILQMNKKTMYAFAVLAPLGAVTQVVASVLVTSRFIFALARDCAIPFSSLLVKTSKSKEPWVADLALIAAMYASLIGWYVPQGNYYSLIQTFSFWFTSLAYLLPLVLYITCKLELQYADRVQFTLRNWSKPLAGVAAAWLVLTLIQGSLPSSIWTTVAMNHLKVDTLSPLPFVILGMLLVMAVSWLLYGRRHYIGPIRALTKWCAGVEINPMDFNSAEGRAKAIHGYIQGQISKGKSKSNGNVNGRGNGNGSGSGSGSGGRSGGGGDSAGGNRAATPGTPATPASRNTFSSPVTPGKSFASRLFRSKRDSNQSRTSASGTGRGTTNLTVVDPNVVPESGVFPHTTTHARSMDPALAESGLLPGGATQLAGLATTTMTTTTADAEGAANTDADGDVALADVSGVLPDSQPRILLPTPIMTRGPHIGVIDEYDEEHDLGDSDLDSDSNVSDGNEGDAFPMRDLRGRGKGSTPLAAQSQLAPFASTGSFGTAPWNAQVESHLDPTASMAAAQAESQLDPTASFAAAQMESQLDPTASFAAAQMESQLEPEPTQAYSRRESRFRNETETQLEALPESQLDPTATAEYGTAGGGYSLYASQPDRRQSRQGLPVPRRW